ncbi:DUF551 domain-containing protein [Serratia marcescens]|uniref:DUF551 domain-containing protein n=1 Tax=Serratia marcescens TaxID=615 RepID=UPI0007609B21|nr:DUF551 domain-containing protein [Serratia marcescens]HEJ6995808.1 DUF551 domain-containing protein [Serratia marcescens]
MKFENWTIDELFERCIDTEDGSMFMNSDEVAALRRKIAELRSAQPVSGSYTLNSPVIPDGWIARSERMPELDKRVLLYFGSYDGHIEDGCIGDDGDGPYHYFFDGDSLQQEPTHWMPLPAAPEGGNG